MNLIKSAAIGLFLSSSLAGGALTQSASTELATLFGEEPGSAKAMACFSRVYDKAHLAGHKDQNVTRMVLFVSKQEGPEQQFALNMQVGFRHLDQPFNVSGGCGLDQNGKKALTCGIECDGGLIDVRVKDNRSILVDIPDSVRVYDPDSAEDNANDLPTHARFGSDDKVFRLDRTDNRDCLPVIFDEDLKAEISSKAPQSQ